MLRDSDGMQWTFVTRRPRLSEGRRAKEKVSCNLTRYEYKINMTTLQNETFARKNDLPV
jgi:hypothetical protein